MANRSETNRASRQPWLLIAEDDDDIRAALTELFTRDGYAVAAVSDGELLLQCLSSCEHHFWLPDAIVTDHRMPMCSSIDVIQRMNRRGWRVPVILITAFGAEVRELATALGARAVLDKPFDPIELRTEVMESIDWSRRRLAATV